MKENKFLLERALHLATACAVIALILFVPATMSKNKGLGIFFYVLSALLLICGGVILYLAHRVKGAQIHYFLYDAESGTALPASALNVACVRKGMDRYLRKYESDLPALWRDIPKELRVRLEQEPAFRPLVAYRLLLALAECEGDRIKSVFLASESRAVGYFCNAIRDGGDAEMADYIFELKKHAKDESSNDARIVSFFRKNRGCFEERMLRYVKRNMHNFYIDQKDH